MLRRFILTTFSISLFGVGAYFAYSGLKNEQHKNVLNNKNPYSRKPASLGIKDPLELDESKKSGSQLDYKYKVKELYRLKKCLSTTCDPKISKRLFRREIMSFYESVLRAEIKDLSITKAAISFLSLENIQIKEASLLLLSTQNSSEEALKSIISNVLYYEDPNLVGLALMELEKYQDENSKEVIAESFLKNFHQTSPLIKNTLAKGLYRVMSKQTKPEYEQLLKKLPIHSELRENIETSLNRYEGQVRL